MVGGGGGRDITTQLPPFTANMFNKVYVSSKTLSKQAAKRVGRVGVGKRFQARTEALFAAARGQAIEDKNVAEQRP